MTASYSYISILSLYLYLYQTTISSVEENWEFIYNKILKIVDEHVPCKLLGVRSHLPWMSTPLKRQIKRKQCIYNRAKRFRRDSDWQEYKNMQAQVRNLIRQQHKN